MQSQMMCPNYKRASSKNCLLPAVVVVGMHMHACTRILSDNCFQDFLLIAAAQWY